MPKTDSPACSGCAMSWRASRSWPVSATNPADLPAPGVICIWQNASPALQSRMKAGSKSRRAVPPARGSRVGRGDRTVRRPSFHSTWRVELAVRKGVPNLQFGRGVPDLQFGKEKSGHGQNRKGAPAFPSAPVSSLCVRPANLPYSGNPEARAKGA